MSLDSVTLGDVAKASKLLKCEKFSGKSKDWPLWSVRFRCSLSTGIVDLEPLLQSATINASADDRKIDVRIEAAKTVMFHLIRCLQDVELAQVVNLPKYSKKQATGGRAPPQPASPARGNSNIPVNAIASALASRPEVLLGWPHPSTAWTTLKNKYEPNTDAHIKQLYMDLYQLKMEGTDFTKYLSDKQARWSQLATLNQPITDEQKYVQLKAGLPEYAEQAQSYLDANDLTLDKGIAYLERWFSRYALQHGDDDGEPETGAKSALQTSAHMVSKKKKKSNGGPNGDRNDKGKCFYCHKKGHKESECRTKMADEAKGKSGGEESKSAGGAGAKTCTFCGRDGHTEAECFTKKRAQKEAQAKTRNAHQVIEDEDHELVALMATTTGAGSTEFIVDSGAETHVCNDQRFFIDLKELDRPLVLRSYNAAAAGEKLTHGGTIEVNVIVNGKKVTARVSNVVYAAHARACLLSTVMLMRRGKGYHDRSTGSAGGTPGRWTLFDGSNKPLLEATMVGKQFKLNLDGDGLSTRARRDPKSMTALLATSAVQAITTSVGVPATGVTATCAPSTGASDATSAQCHSGTCARSSDVTSASGVQEHVLDNVPNAMLLLHQRMGHPDVKKVVQVIKDQALKVPITDAEQLAIKNCETCKLGKATHRPFHRTVKDEHRAKELLERVHSDVWGPAPVTSRGGSRYLLNFVDNKTRFAITEPIKKKSDVPDKVIDYFRFVWAHKDKSTRFFVHDNAKEYSVSKVRTFLRENGTAVEMTAPASSEENGISERVHRSIIDKARCMLFEAGMPANMWAEAARHATDVYNMTPHSALDGRTPYELWTGKKPDLARLKVFGCAAYVLREGVSKLSPKVNQVVYLGQEPEHWCYRLYDPATQRLFASRNVTFNECKFPIKDKKEAAKNDVMEHVDGPDPFTVKKEDGEDGDNAGSDSDDGDDEQMDVMDDEDEKYDDGDDDGKAAAPLAAQRPVVPAYSSGVQGQRPLPPSPQLGPVPIYTSPPHAQQQRRRRNLQEEHPSRISNRGNRGVPPLRYGSNYVDVLLSMTDDEPRTYRDAMASNDKRQWQEATQREMDALHKNGTWILVDRPRDKHVITGKWVFRIKVKDDGTIDKYKARYVIKGFMQRPGQEFDETFAPVAQMKSLRVLLAIAAIKKYKLYQLDVTSAFLNGKIDKEIYMEQPEGFNDGTDRVCLLKKSLYGLKQAPRIWNSDVDATLVSLGLKRCISDPCVYVYDVGDKKLILLIYVDDCVLIYNDDATRDSVVARLKDKYDVQVCGELKWILGQRVTTTDDAITLDQQLYASKILDNFGMSHCTPVTTPAVEAAPASATDEQVDLSTYRSVVGSLLYATNCTRPDLAFATSTACRYMASPTPDHERAAKRILRYLRGHTGDAIKFNKTGNDKVELTGYSDASWGNDYETARSVSGYVFMLGGAPVSWCSKLQHLTALSSTEAEYIALSFASQEATWLRALLAELGFDQAEPTTIRVDNQSAIAIAENPVHHSRTKHMNIKVHHVRELVHDGAIRLEWCPTEEQVADIFTKPLGSVLFKRHAAALLCEQVDDA